MQGIKGPTAPSSVSAAGKGSHQPPATSHQLLAGDGGVPALLQGQEESESGAGRGGGSKKLAGVPALLQGREESEPGAGKPPAISHQPPGGAVGNGKDKKGESGRETGGQAGSQGKGRVLLNQGKVGHHKWRRTRSDTRGRGPASGPGCPAPRQRPWLSRTPADRGKVRNTQDT